MKAAIFLSTLLVLILFSIPCQAQEYRVGEGDVLKISVYDNPDLEKTVRVSGEGAIVLPLIGEVSVGDLTVSAVTRRITDLLADGYLINPHVSVFVEEFRSKKAIILGEVNRPGLYEISGDITFLEMISKAEGFTKTAGNRAVIKRRLKPGQETPEIIRIDLKDFVERGLRSMWRWKMVTAYTSKRPVFIM
jgi:polysaccharide export outer membrane protein